jgi:hypothetical protein
MGASTPTKPTEADGICREQWCKDIVTLRAKSRTERSRQDNFFAKLDQSVLRWSNVDTPESCVMRTDSPFIVHRISPHYCITASLHNG